MPPWERVTGKEVRQGDLIPSCTVLLPTPAAHEAADQALIERGTRDVIVVTHSCDLLNPPTPRMIACCPIGTVREFEIQNPDMGRSGRWGHVRQGRVPTLHLIDSPATPEDFQESLVVDFREIYPIPNEYLLQLAVLMGARWRLVPPHLEAFSRAFGDCYSRVGLPAPVART